MYQNVQLWAFMTTALLLTAIHSAIIDEVVKNPASGKSSKDVTPEKALDLPEGHTLVKKQSDKKPTQHNTLLTKYQQQYKGLDVYGFGVTLEVTADGIWTDFAHGLIARDIEQDLFSKKAQPDAEIKRYALERAGYDHNNHITDYEKSKKKRLIYVDTSEKGGNSSKVAMALNFLIFKDKSLVQPRNENRKVEYPGSSTTNTASTDQKAAPASGTQTRGKRAAADDNHYDRTTKEVLSNPQLIIDVVTGDFLEYQDQLVSAPYPKTAGWGGNIVVGKHQYNNWEWAGRRLVMDRPNPLVPLCRAENHLAAVSSAGGSFPTGGCFVSGSPWSPYLQWCGLTTSTDQYPSAANPETFSQVHDGLYFATRFQEMLQILYGDTTLQTCCGQVRLCVHYGPWDNAMFYDQGHCESYYGDGNTLFYGLASADVVTHELGHAIIKCTSGLQYSCQSGGMNEAFADISGIVFKAFLQGHHTNWMIGDTIMRAIGWQDALRFMNDPPKDNRSIDCNNDYTCQNVHYTSGVYNKGFYNLVMMEHWCLRTAYAVFLRATKLYWNSLTGFDEGLCGLIWAATDLGYRADDVREAFAKVGVFCGCPKGWFSRVEYIDHFPHGRRTTCYKIVEDVASWAEARVYCNSMESDLVVLDNQNEIQWMTKYLTWLSTTTSQSYKHQHHLLEKSEYWIGSTDMSTEGGWRWVPHDNPVTNAYWRSGEPNNFQTVQNCAALRQFTTSSNTYPITWNWVDDDCYQKKFFICERSCCGKSCRKNY